MILKKGLEKYLKDFRKKYIPPQYNQLEFLEGLYDPKCATMISISNRRDGKTFNVINFLLHLALDYGLPTIIFTSHDFIRASMVEQVRDVVHKAKDLHEKQLTNLHTTEFDRMFYDDTDVFMVTNLDNATDLKNFSGLLSMYALTWYDEFLAVDGIYDPNEFAYFETIFQTMDRGERDFLAPLGGMRKAIFTGNAVDFGSPFLAHWDLYEALSETKMNTVKKYKFFYIERRRNDSANEDAIKNPMFSSDSDSFTGNFIYNSFAIKKNKEAGNFYKVKIPKLHGGGCIVVYYEQKLLGYTPDEEDYSFALSLDDVTKDSVYVSNEKYIKDDFYKKYDQKNGKSIYTFTNAYIKRLVIENYPNINFDKLTKLYRRKKTADTPQEDDKKLKLSHEDYLKKKIFADFFL